MPRTPLLDTSVYSQPVKRTRHPAVAARWQALDAAAIVVSAVCEAELLCGLQKHGSPQMRETYESILHGRFPVPPVDTDVATTYADLHTECERRGITVDNMALLIATTAMTHHLTVATLNVGHFSVFPCLAVEDWSQPPTA